jgi:hypothetical protein
MRGQLLSGWVKQVDVMVDELTTQEQGKGAKRAVVRSRAKARVRAFLRRIFGYEETGETS